MQAFLLPAVSMLCWTPGSWGHRVMSKQSRALLSYVTRVFVLAFAVQKKDPLPAKCAQPAPTKITSTRTRPAMPTERWVARSRGPSSHSLGFTTFGVPAATEAAPEKTPEACRGTPGPQGRVCLGSDPLDALSASLRQSLQRRQNQESGSCIH